nr:PREDICTED: pumilio homolog 2 isoform X6 [Bemisia tabaci]
MKDMGPDMIAPSAKKLWGVEEVKEDGPKGILNLNDHQMWRNPTWSTSDHTVSQPMMVARRSGSFPGSEVASNILSPRSSETSGLGVKMVEYVLSTSPKREDHLDARMRGLVLNNEGGVEGVKKDDKNKGQKELVENGNCGTTVVQQNGGIVVVQNGTVLDDDKTFNDSSVAGHPYSGITSLNSHILQERISIRTPGSRQPSPSDEDLTKNGVGGMMVIDSGDTLLGQQVQMAPPPHHHLTAADFSHPFHTPPQGYSGGTQTSGPPQQPGPPQESPSVMQPSFDVQQLFRSQQQQAAVAGAANPATAQQLQLLQQQQYLQQQQQLTAGLPGATFAPPAPYIINPQEPYVITGPTVVPQYYGVHGVPWGVYPANIIQQSHSAAAAAAQQRRPLSPTSAATESANIQTQVQPSGYQMIPAYYDQNGSIMVTRGLSNGTPTVRLVSPAPVLVNHAAAATTPGLPAQTPSGSFGNNLNSVTSSLSSLGTGLGLGSGSSGRRDSFDRNTSAFSPSLDYGRAKWPQNYGALGTVTASPSPLGLASGSLTPPPALGSSSNLQLGALMGNTSSRTTLLSAAPGAEGMSKFRSNGTLATNGEYLNGATAMFGTPTTTSLFAKLAMRPNSSLAGTSMPLDPKPTGRSRLLEDFRNNRYPSLQLRDLTNHIVEFSQDQHGSRFIQQKLERATVAEKQLVFSEIISCAYNLMTDVFGNYVIQKFFEFGTPEQKATLAQKVRGHVLPLALQMYGCRVIQKALESISGEQQVEIVRELDGHVLKCVKDQNGNHVVQKCIECVDPHALQFIINAFQGQVLSLSTHPYGCRVIQRILEHCTPEQTAPILEELHQHTDTLIQDQYGNYVIQHVLEHGKPEDKSLLINAVRNKVLALSQHKFASNVVEKCVTYSTRAERALLIEEVCGFNDSALHVMMKDQFANYVVQKMLDVCEAPQRKVLMHKIRPHFASLRKYTYGKHIIAKLEKFFLKSPSSVVNDLGPIGPPTNGVL